MKYIKEFESKKKLNFYNVFYNFLNEIKTDRKYILVNDYGSNEKHEKGLAFTVGKNVLFILKFIRTEKFETYGITSKFWINRITINECPFYNLPDEFRDYGYHAREIVNYLQEILMKITQDTRVTASCESFYYLEDNDVEELKKELTKENFELYLHMKKYNM